MRSAKRLLGPYCQGRAQMRDTHADVSSWIWQNDAGQATSFHEHGAGFVNGILAEGLLQAHDIKGLGGNDAILSLLAAAQSSQLYVSVRTTRCSFIDHMGS